MPRTSRPARTARRSWRSSAASTTLRRSRRRSCRRRVGHRPPAPVGGAQPGRGFSRGAYYADGRQPLPAGPRRRRGAAARHRLLREPARTGAAATRRRVRGLPLAAPRSPVAKRRPRPSARLAAVARGSGCGALRHRGPRRGPDAALARSVRAGAGGLARVSRRPTVARTNRALACRRLRRVWPHPGGIEHGAIPCCDAAAWWKGLTP